MDKKHQHRQTTDGFSAPKMSSYYGQQPNVAPINDVNHTTQNPERERERERESRRPLRLPKTTGGLVALIITALALLGGGGTYAALYIGSSGQGDVNLQAGLVGHWKLDGNATDSSPNNNHGTINGAIATTDRQDKTDSAYSFDGENDNIQIPGDSSIESWPDGVTVSVWAKSDTSTWNETGFLVSKRSSFIIHPNAGTKDVRFYIHDGSSWTSVTQTVSGDITGWHLYTATYDNSNLKIYIDGEEPSETSISGTINSDTGDMFFGQDDGSATRFFDGRLDDVRVYNRAINEAEVQAIYSQYDSKLSIGNLNAGLVGHWKLDGNAKDATPYANNGVIDGTTLTADRSGISGKALSLPGNSTSDKVTIDPMDDFPSTTMTTSFWVKTSGASSGIVSYAPSSGSNNEWLIFNPANLTIYAGNANTNTGIDIRSSEWKHVVTTWRSDTGETKVYVDGALEATRILAQGTSLQNDGCLMFGQEQDSRCGGLDANQSLNGDLDDVRIYNWVLSADDVQRLYTSYSSQISLYGGGTTSGNSIGAGLIGHWPFSGNANDATPYSNNGTVNGATLTTNRFGQANSAYSFDGDDDRINFSNDLMAIGQPELTISAWIYPTNLSGSQAIVNRNGPYVLWTHASGYRIQTGLHQGSWYWSYSSVNSLVENVWQHVVMTYDGSSRKIYINGQQNGPSDTQISGNISGTTSSSLAVGFDACCGGRNYFEGKIDDVRMYNRALSDSEVQQLYSSN